MTELHKTTDGVRGCYPLLEFVPDVSLILGKRGIGKSFFVINDIYPRVSDEIEDIFVIADLTNTEYLQITDKIYSLEDLEHICRYLDSPERKHVKKLLIIDNYSKEVFSNNKLINLSCLTYELNLKIIFVKSSSVGLSPHLRTNIKWVLFGNESCISEIKRNYDLFGGQFKNYEYFTEHYNIIGGWEFMAVDITQNEPYINFVKAGKQVKLKKIFTPKIEISEESELNTLISEVNSTINQLVGIRNKLKAMKKLTS
jgi:hypothetical protein